MTEDGAARAAARFLRARSSGTSPGPGYWLLLKDEDGGVEVFTVDLPLGGEALPVFSFREEAELFIWSENGGGWRVRYSDARELLSVFYSSCSGVESVVLDPLPRMLTEKTLGLVALSWERFVVHLLDSPEGE